MTDLDLSRAHIVMGPHKYAYANWWGACSCGEEFFGATADEVRQAWIPHREAERKRLAEDRLQVPRKTARFQK
jgi:hypothetical protein